MRNFQSLLASEINVLWHQKNQSVLEEVVIWEKLYFLIIAWYAMQRECTNMCQAGEEFPNKILTDTAQIAIREAAEQHMNEFGRNFKYFLNIMSVFQPSD